MAASSAQPSRSQSGTPQLPTPSDSAVTTEPSTPLTPASFAIPPPVVVPRERVSPHFRYNFNDESTKFYCEVWYADEFRQLRRLLINGGETTGNADSGDDKEEAFVRSLARYVVRHRVCGEDACP